MQDGNEDKRIKSTPDVMDPTPIQWYSPEWRTPELPSSYFVTTSRFPYSAQSQATPITNDGHSPEVRIYGGPPISSHIQRVVRQVASSRAITQQPEFVPSHRRREVAAKESRRTRPEVAATQRPTMRPQVDGAQRPPRRPEFPASQHRTKRPHEACSLPPNKKPHVIHDDTYTSCPPSKRHETGTQRQQIFRDPLLHRPLVTPPGPILPGQNQTPSAARSYTHVSNYKENSAQ